MTTLIPEPGSDDHGARPRAVSSLAARTPLRLAIAFVAGAVLLSLALRVDQRSEWFPAIALAAAAVWVWGALPVRRSTLTPPNPLIALRRGVIAGLALAAVAMLLTAWLDTLPLFERHARDLVGYANAGFAPVTVIVIIVSGICEELYFRGALFVAAARRPVVLTTVAYTLAVAGTGNVPLISAAAVFGVVAGLARRRSGSVATTAAMHVAFSLAMLIGLPLIVD